MADRYSAKSKTHILVGLWIYNSNQRFIIPYSAKKWQHTPLELRVQTGLLILKTEMKETDCWNENDFYFCSLWKHCLLKTTKQLASPLPKEKREKLKQNTIH